MNTFRKGLGHRLDDSTAQLFPGYFALVMATGAVAIDTYVLGMPSLAWLLALLGTFAYAGLWLLTLMRAMRYPRRLVGDLNDHARGPGFFTLVAATGILGTQWLLIAQATLAAQLLWLLAVTLWLAVMYAFFIAVIVQQDKPAMEQSINGAWLLTTVSTQSVAVLTALLPWSEARSEAALLFALCMFLLGCALYLIIITLIVYRLVFLRLSAAALTPPYWINMGAVAITTLAGSTLILRAGSDTLLTDFVPFLKGFTLLFWALASWWIPLLVGLSLWRHLVRRYPLRYDAQLWGMVFPLGMYTTGTLSLSQALDIGFLRAIPQVTVWFALTAWLIVGLAMLNHWRHLPPDSA
ncbi:Tellurite resistance protein TehA [Modicisalibacter muralis]|uniref:Tellurite resistance protein TehA n=1 Tax=Modicisalibacter muralis TaxID=119000 RepID=A0A1G9QQ51_9GAMM|nr:tellurite resistance/C4-dicarboxylate transporter family protein [Halomonas muralis]SDM13139.1 Tellurite resistance protein TehA [Halomonas muralis]